MFCKTCNYALWNLKERTCPECGNGFAPSQFRFKPNSIRFLCPHCSQHYYGTTRTGHLTPRAFQCVTCRNDIDMDQMVLLPAEGLDERQTRASGNPWIESPGRPRVRDWFRTTGRSLFSPAGLIAATDEDTPLRATLSYAVLTAALASALSIVIPFMVLAPFLAPLGINAKGFTALAVYVLGVILSALITYAAVPLYACCAHLILRGGKPKRRLRTTIHAVAMSSGSNVLWGIPVFGIMTGPAGLLWWGISLAVMLRTIHGVRTLRAFVAGLGPPLALCTLILGAFIAMIIWSFSVAATAATGFGQIARNQVLVAEQVWREAAETGERHLGSLILEEKISLSTAIAPVFTETSAIFTGGIDITQAMLSGTDEQRAALVATLDASLTPDVIAYRVGDLVVIRDVPHPSPSPALWRCVYSPDPAANPGFAAMAVTMQPQNAPNVPVPLNPGAMIGGSTNATVGPTTTEQNRIRAKHGLPPLPALHTILTFKPFTKADVQTPIDDPAPEPPTESPPGG